MKLSKGWQYSAILHITILLLMIFGLPAFLHRHIDAEPPVISVEILPIAKESNVKPQEQTPEKIEEKKPVEEKQTERKQTVEAKKPEQKPQETPIPVKAAVVIKKPEPKPEPKKKVEKKVDDLDKILNSVKETAKSEESKKPTEAKPTNTKKAVSQNYDASKPLSMSEIDAIRQQIQQCWNPPIGAKDAENLIINLRINIAEDGTVTKVDLDSDESRYNSDSFFKAAADSAMRAVHKCSPLKNLPADKFSTWSDITMTFNPKDMF